MFGRTKLKFNEFRTMVTEIEAILNDRPLTYVSSDLNDPQALTPFHLLYDGRLTPLPYDLAVEEELLDPTFGKKLSHLLAMFSRRQRILKAFWSRWQREHLTSLRERHITSKNGFKPSIKVGDVVLVHNEGPRIDWKLAVIDSLITSPDGEIQAANIRTAKGKTNRPVSKLFRWKFPQQLILLHALKFLPIPTLLYQRDPDEKQPSLPKNGSGTKRKNKYFRPGICRKLSPEFVNTVHFPIPPFCLGRFTPFAPLASRGS